MTACGALSPTETFGEYRRGRCRVRRVQIQWHVDQAEGSRRAFEVTRLDPGIAYCQRERPASPTLAAEKLALALPGVEAGTSYGTPSLRVQKKFLARLREPDASVLTAIDDVEKEFLLATQPRLFFITTTTPDIRIILIRLSKVDRAAAQGDVAMTWHRVAGKRLLAEQAGSARQRCDSIRRGGRLMAAYTKPIPQADEESREFYEGARRRELMLMRCRDCGVWRLPSRPRCPDCWSTDTAWAKASGLGTLYSFGIMHQKFPGFSDEGPYNYAIVELDEGPRIVTNIVGVPRTSSSRHARAGGLRRRRRGHDADPVHEGAREPEFTRGGERPKPQAGEIVDLGPHELHGTPYFAVLYQIRRPNPDRQREARLAPRHDLPQIPKRVDRPHRIDPFRPGRPHDQGHADQLARAKSRASTSDFHNPPRVLHPIPYAAHTPRSMPRCLRTPKMKAEDTASGGTTTCHEQH